MLDPDPEQGCIAPLAALPLPAGFSARQRPTAGRHRRPPRNGPGHRGDHLQASGQPRARRVACSFVLASVPGAAEVFTAGTARHDWSSLLTDTVRHVLAGTAARTCAQVCIHPIDTVKTRLQVNKAGAPELLRSWRSGSKAQPLDVYLGPRRVAHFRNVLFKGPRDVYLGLTGAVLGTIPTALLYFATYEYCKERLAARGHVQAFTHVVSASAGAVVSAFVRVPTDTLKHRVQAYVLPDVFRGARSIVANEGMGGLYSGLLPTLLRDVPEIAIQFTLYENLRRLVERRRGVAKLRTWEHLLLGGLSGATAASVTMPLDFAKTVLQTGGTQPIQQVFANAVRDKGVGGLFAGMGPRVMQTAVMSAVFFTLFEFWKAQLKGPAARAHDDRLMMPKIWLKRRDHVWKRQFVYQ
ncbi:hypothetical protein WJX81_001695 [Elliptochloris bilobata]|uniref:Mitochondrial carrier protein n=1 Tax=Elliptochloris bilobata TaxID=381761 RepID=A0AAW1S4Q5_9CHLO